MKWNKYTIETTTAAEDVISALLDGQGIEGVEIENNVPLTEEEAGGMFIDYPAELPPDDGTSRVSFYLDDGQDNERILSQVRTALDGARAFLDIGPGEITRSQTEDTDWINNWKQFFKPFTVGNLLIKPTWEERKAEDAGRIVIEIDPGISFGTGKHETTQLCIRQLEKYIEEGVGSEPDDTECGQEALDAGRDSGTKCGQEVLDAERDSGTKCCPKVMDVGCGSGILSVVALKLGAASVTGIDIDENCIVSAYENMKVNHLDRSLCNFYAGNIIEDKALQEQEGSGAYDIVAANILADVLIPLSPVIYPCLRKGGIFITSGIIDFKEQEVRDAITQAGFQVLETNRQGEWVNITARKLA